MITTPHLTDWLVNNDLEVQLANRDYNAIFEYMIDGHPDPDGENISDEQLKEAVELALDDSYVQTFAVPLVKQETV
ncbi:hypothetical protein ACFWP5_08950 [Streptomyces sp. NPDC058469]|uniref:hypothetical protein n=1 Tax=Streptomyces sp. NPDC058469 TaxID=3346514 RepID=UPI00364C8D99